MEKRPTKEQLATFKKNANDMSLSAEVRAKFKAIVDKFENIGEEVVDVVEGKKERKPRTPKATTTRKPRATKQTGDDVEMAKAEIKKRTGKTEEECESIIEQYKALRTKSQERKKKEAEASKSNVARINKLKGDNKVIEGTTEKTADAVIQSTTKDVAEKIEKQIEVIEKKAETEAKKEVEKEMPKESATEKKKEVEKRVEEKVKKETKKIVKPLVIDTSALLTSIAESLGLFGDKDSQKEFLIKLRSDIDKLLAKYSGGGMTMGATQGYNITQSNLSSSSVNMFGNGGGVDNKKRFDVDFYDSSDANRDTSIEISIRENTLEDAIEDAIKKANEFQKNYIEFYHRNMFLGSINFAVSKEFRQGKGYNDFVNNRFNDGGGVEDVIVYDNGGESLDRYTIFTPDGSVYGMSESGGGFNQYLGDDTEVEKGSHLGKRLKSVPKSIEKAVMQRMNDSYAKGGGVFPTRTIGDMTYKIIKDGNGYNVSASKVGYSAWKVGKPMSKVEAVKLLESLVDRKAKGNKFSEGGGVKGRQKDDYNKLVGSIDNEYYFVDYIFNDADGFKGATGTIVMPVSKEYYDLATSEEGILDRYMTAMGEDEWLNTLGLDRDDFEDEDEMIKAIEDGIYDLYRVGELNPFEEVNYKLEEQMRKLPEFSDSDEYPIFETIGGGRIFGKDTKFDKIYDQELYNKIRKIEEFKRGGGVYNRSWHFDRARHNKSENYEVPMNRRKKAHGGTIEERMRMRRGM